MASLPSAPDSSKRPGRRRWLVRATKSLFVVTDHPKWAGSRGAQESGVIRFLGLSRETGAAREGSDSPEGLEGKLKGLHSSELAGSQACAAILGVLTAHQESFLLLASEAALVMEAGSQRIYEVTRCDALPFGSSEPSADAQSALAGVKQLLERNFYFSEGFDLTRRLQYRLLQCGGDGTADDEELMTLADDRFVWNKQLVAPLLCQGVAARWFTPVMQGFVQAREVPPLMLLLVARRSCRRAGTRYNARGLDDEGEVGNWVETEQLVRLRSSSAPTEGGWLALLQVRGSAPVFWEQPSQLSAITVTRGPELGAVAFQKHLDLLRASYGEVIFVNLLSGSAAKRETEGVLTSALNEQLQKRSDLQVFHLDFHARVSGDEGQFDRELDSLANDLAGHLQRFGFLDATSNVAIGSRQTGVIRTNCFDCLDRTNVLQYQLVWRWLSLYCSHRSDLCVLLKPTAPPQPAGKEKSTSIEGFFRGALNDIMPEEAPQAPLQLALRGLWADLGDALSEQYTGTASTMGAALRKGGHNTFTLLEKGWLSVNRAYCARFGDEARQAALELLLGKHRLLRAPSGQPEARRAPCGQLTVAVVTWNLHGHKLWEAPGVLETLIKGACAPGSQRVPDVVVFCFQEFLELSAENVVLKTAGDEERQAAFEAIAGKALGQALGEAFVKVRSVGMVGLYIGAFVAERMRGSISGVAGDRVKSGMYGQAGNKGAVAVRFVVAKTALCAMSLHLESGTGKAAERAAQLKEALQGLFVPGGPSRVGLAAMKHDLVVLGGDFNFRLSLPQGADNDAVQSAFEGTWPPATAPNDPACIGEGVSPGHPLEKRCADIFATYDELRGNNGCLDAKDVLREEGLMEGPVLFPPTYKFLEHSQGYDAERSPAWCDRVIHSKVGVVRRRYCALGGMLQSDHRPVAALLETQLLALPEPGPGTQQPLQQRDSIALVEPAAAVEPAAMMEPVVREPAEDLLGFEEGSSSAASPAPAVSPASAPVAAADTVNLLGDSPSSKTTTLAPGEDLLGGTPPKQAAAPPPAPVPAAPPPGHVPNPASLSPGRLVLAHFSGGWYYARVLRAGASTCDIAWLRPAGTLWGSEEMARYLCSTGADETLHGDNLPLATHIRIEDDAASAKADPDLLGGMDTPAAAPSSGGEAASVDLLG